MADGDATNARIEAISESLIDLATALEQQHHDLRLALDVLVQLAAKVDQSTAALAPLNGMEVGALMGATQAAWLRLEQRLESEFTDIQRQLRTLSGTEAAATATPAITSPVSTASSPGASGDQLRRAATSLRATVRSLRRTRP